MDVKEAIKTRRSVRKYLSKEIQQDYIELLQEALIWAPSSGNTQCRKFYFVFNKDIKSKLTEAAYGQQFISQVSLVVVCCTDNEIKQYYGQRGLDLYSVCDVSASIENLLLQAEELNLATCWVGAFKENEVIKALELPENLKPIALIPVGYADDSPQPLTRVAVEKSIKIIY